MSIYREEHCGIDVPHRHTGEIIEGHHVTWWCKVQTKWVKFEELCSVPDCDHTTARVMTTTTEKIEILSDVVVKYGTPLVSYIKGKLEEQLDYLLFHGDEAFEAKYGKVE